MSAIGKPPISLTQVRSALRAPLPGYPAQERMATRPRLVLQRAPTDAPPVQAAVLLALFERDGTLWLPLTVRSNDVAHHRGQISFPGGAREAEDADAWANALREAHEELGLDPLRMQSLGALTPLYIPGSHFQVHPWVAHLLEPPVYRPDRREVAEVIELPLDLVLDAGSKGLEEWTLQGQPTLVPCYRYGAHVIWGATAMMLSEFEMLLSGAAAWDPADSQGGACATST